MTAFLDPSLIQSATATSTLVLSMVCTIIVVAIHLLLYLEINRKPKRKLSNQPSARCQCDGVYSILLNKTGSLNSAP